MKIFDALVSSEVRARVDALELPWNHYELDPYGVSKRDLGVFFSGLEPIYRQYFDVRVHGRENVPEKGRGMLVGNHSGGIALDAMMVFASCFFELEPPRLAQGMVEKFIHKLPGASQLFTRAGQVMGLPSHARRLLEEERLLMVFPEGARGTAKLASEADTLVHFGSGFMRLALATRTPVVPFAFVGGGEAVPTIANLYGLGKILGVPYVPVTPYLLPLPRPTRLEILYGEPMRFEGDGTEPDPIIFGYVEQVRTRIGWLIDQGRRVRDGRLDVRELELG